MFFIYNYKKIPMPGRKEKFEKMDTPNKKALIKDSDLNLFSSTET
jgi:hypothetical protein